MSPHRMESERVLTKGGSQSVWLGHRYPAVVLILLMFFAMALLPTAPAHSRHTFERPAELETDIQFWRNVFTQIDSDHAFLHDSRHLDVVYETVRIPARSTARDRRRLADARRDSYRKTLQKLAAGVRSGLNEEEQRVLALWPKDVSNAELKAAANRIRFQQGLSNAFRAGLERSGEWRAYIVNQLQAEGVPTGLAALPHVESSFNPEARSHAGAAGLWQFTRSTGRRFMQIDHVADERRDPYRSSESAAQLLAYNYSVLKSWPLAITAYNHGVSGMRRAVRDTGTTDIATINRQYKGRTFGFASRNFYVAFLAALDVEREAKRYFDEINFNPPRKDVLIVSPRYVPARAIAMAARVSYAELQAANPGLLQPVWDGTKHVPRDFVIRIPDALTPLRAEEIIAAIPAAQRFAAQTPDQYHKVKSGESLSVIAVRYDASINELVALNKLKNRHQIRIGQVLRLPYAGLSIPEGAQTYKVQSGDSLSLIATRAGISQAQLIQLNNLPDKNRIYVGQILYLAPPDEPMRETSKTDPADKSAAAMVEQEA